MLIQVVYDDERFDYVKDFMLDGLIESGKVTRFRRQTGWVTVGVDPIRDPKKSRTAPSGGIERRTTYQS